MREGGNHRGARTLSVAVAAGLVAFELGLASGAGNVGIPGFYLLRLSDLIGPSRESLVAKQPADPSAGKASRLDSMPWARPQQDGTPPAVVTTDLPPVVAEAGLPTAVAAVPAVRNSSIAPVVAENVPASAQMASGLDMKSALSTLPPQAVVGEPKEEKAVAEEEKKPRPAPKMSEDLPWDAIQPVSVQHSSPRTETPAAVPVDEDAKAWVRAKALAPEGGIDVSGRQRYRFELWIEPPAEVKQRLVAVAYDFLSPSAQPRAQESREANTGFRVRYGDLACSEKILLLLQFQDGKSERVTIDGCGLTR
jgi:hypothetical protein